MNIIKISMRNHLSGACFEPLIPKELTLLLGVSGVGKSRYLGIIYEMNKIICGDTAGLAGNEWCCIFAYKEKEYEWSGGFNEHECFIYEKLLCNGVEIISRNEEGVLYNHIKIPPVAEKLSCLNIFTGIEAVKNAGEALRLIFYLGNDEKNQKMMTQFISELNQNTEAGMIIKEDFISIFDSVEDIVVINNQLHIKEFGSVFNIDEISSGMYRSLYFIVNVNLLPENSVVLIDEFENSLGTNCLSMITDVISLNRRNMQFIITSHHPYIINNIDLSNWMIVTRTGKNLSLKTAEDLHLGKSRHDAFMQLINSDAYLRGLHS